MSNSKKKVVEIGSAPNLPRQKFWLEELKLSDLEIIHQVHGDKLDFDRDMDAMIFEQWASPSDFKYFRGVSSEILDVDSFECVFRENGQLVVRILITDAIHRLIVKRNPDLSNLNVAYVTGEEAVSAAIVILLVKMGFRKIYWVVPEPEMIKNEVKKLRKKYFDVAIEPLQDSDLILQGNDGSIFINFYSETNNEKTEALNDFAYLNFLKHEGLVLDVPFSFWPSEIIQEAENSKVKAVDSIDVHGLRDFLFLQHLNVNLPFVNSVDSIAEYLKLWREFLGRMNK